MIMVVTFSTWIRLLWLLSGKNVSNETDRRNADLVIGAENCGEGRKGEITSNIYLQKEISYWVYPLSFTYRLRNTLWTLKSTWVNGFLGIVSPLISGWTIMVLTIDSNYNFVLCAGATWKLILNIPCWQHSVLPATSAKEFISPNIHFLNA